VFAEMTGGAGGGSELRAKGYRKATLGLIVADLVREAGDAAHSLGEGVADEIVDAWARRAATPEVGLTALAVRYGYTWRTLADGTVWFGTDTFDELDFGHTLIDMQPAERRLVIATDGDAPTLRPGVTFEGQRIVQVVHELTDSALRTTAWWA
jgi:hypothetical protein